MLPEMLGASKLAVFRVSYRYSPAKRCLDPDLEDLKIKGEIVALCESSIRSLSAGSGSICVSEKRIKGQGTLQSHKNVRLAQDAAVFPKISMK